MRQEDQMKGGKVVVWCVILGAVTLVAWLIASTVLFRRACSGKEGNVRPDTVRVVVHDTVSVVKPAPINVRLLPDMVVRLPRWVAPHATGEADKQQACDSVMADAECPADSADVMAPVEQKTYTDSVNYRAVISGAWVSLDTIEIYRQHEIATITKPPDRRRWSIGVGVGYGMTPKGFQPWVGITASYTLFRF